MSVAHGCACPVLVIYDYAITFERELAVAWRFSLTSLLLISMRWTLLFIEILTLTPVTTVSLNYYFFFARILINNVAPPS